MTWQVLILPAAEDELDKLPAKEADAIGKAVEKLKTSGPRLGYPHTSAIKGARKLRELRPRQGDSPWRAFYRQIGQVLVIAAIGPEAKVDPKEFQRALDAAEERLEDLED